MTSDKVIDFLILSEYLPSYFTSRKDESTLAKSQNPNTHTNTTSSDPHELLLGVFKLLQNYCILYFSNHSLEVIEATDDLKI